MCSPYKFTIKKKEAFLSNLREGMRRGAAAEAVGISRATICYHMKADLEFADQVDRAEMEAHEIVEDALFQAASSGNVPSMIFWLCNRVPDKWRNVQRQEHSGPGGGPIEHRDAPDMTVYTEEELKTMRSIHEAAYARRNSGGTSEA